MVNNFDFQKKKKKKKKKKRGLRPPFGSIDTLEFNAKKRSSLAIKLTEKY